MKYGKIMSMSLLGLVPAEAFAASDDARKPNVIVILADDYGWKDAGFMGSDIYETPNLDRLASRSVVFTNGYAACSVSSPSRGSILTGLYPTRHGITTWIGDPCGEDWRVKGRHNRMLPAQYAWELDPSFVTIPEVLREHGYRTFMAGKWHLGDKVNPEDQGFDINVGGWEAGNPKGGYFSPYANPALEDGPAGENLSERLCRETARFIEQEAGEGRPFFAYLSFYAVHGPIQTTEELWNKYRKKITDLGLNEGEGLYVDRLMPVRKYQDNPVYAGLIEQMDRGIGIVLDKIEELGIGDNTVIIFTSDNGGVASGDNFATSILPLRGGKGRQWEGGTRVPYIIHTPGMERSRISYTPVSGIDIFPTVLEMAGAGSRDVDGTSLVPLLEGRTTKTLKTRPLFWHYPHYGNQGGEPSSTIRKGDWKLIWYHEDERYELYNLAEDIGEHHQLEGKYPGKVEELKSELQNWLRETNAKFPSRDPEWTAETEKAYLDKAIPKALERQEGIRHAMLDPNWSPDASWWGSRPFSNGWKFILDDIAEASVKDFDDSGWRTLNVPHDWAFEQGYSPDAAQEDKGGYACGGIGWYRKHFTLYANEINERQIFVDFDGVYMNSEVWINGHYLGKRPYGYISFSYDITPYIKAGNNVISVRVDNSREPSARWYHGCGIYGDVRLRYEKPLHFVKDGIYITTPVADSLKSTVSVTYELSQSPKATVEAWIEKEGRGVSDTLSTADGKLLFSLGKTTLWSPETPELYTLKMRVYDSNGKVSDSESIDFGIRSIKWVAAKGFYLNGKQTKLRGVCEHLEGGPVGAAWTRDLLEWKLKMLKEMGCNAIRTAHNPQVPMFYDLCDRIGLMVMDEAFDGWKAKAPQDYGAQAFAEWWEIDLRAMLRRDRNHPCVIAWSVGNETSGDVAASLVKVCRSEDPTRLVTSGDSSADQMDIIGINGKSEKQSFYKNYKPGLRAFVGTETPHTWQTRGYYRTMTWYRDGYPNKGQDPFLIPDLTEKEVFGYDWTSPEERRNVKQVFNSSYDNATVRLTARHNLAFLRDLDWYSGHFRWTGFDYPGEAGYVHGGWPFRTFQGGVIDLAGFKKDHFYLYQSQWREDIDMVHILPHWTHPDIAEGTIIPVWVYTTGDEAELLLNGRSLGRVKKGLDWDKMQCGWDVPWTPGKLTAIAYRNGMEICRESISTAGAPATFSVKKEGDIENGHAILTFTQKDKEGNIFPYGDNRIFISLTNATVQSFENGNPVDTECRWQAPSLRCFYGMSRAFIRRNESVGNVVALAGMICGDRSCKVSDEASIVVHEITLKGKNARHQFEVRYTLDGSKPGRESALYTGPFRIAPGMKVRAKVWCNGNEVLSMEEDFGNGIFWGVPGAAPCKDEGSQAEYMDLSGAVVRNTSGLDVYGGGYVFFKEKGGSISWYQENDGAAYDSVLKIRYSQGRTATGVTRAELTNNGASVCIIDFKDTGSENSDWTELEVPVTLISGANNLSIKILDKSGPSIDSISL